MAPFREPIFHNLTVNDGLAHRTAHAIVQDHQGNIWIATNNGLNRYDGNTMHTYRWDINDPSSLSGNLIDQLFISKKNQLWIITANGKLCRYRFAHDSFETILLDGKNFYVRSISEDPIGDVWILGRGNEIFKLLEARDSLQIQSMGRANSKDGTAFQINDLVLDSQNRLWVGTAQSEIHLFSIQKEGILYEKQLFESQGNLKLIKGKKKDEIWLTDNVKIFQARPEKIPRIELLCDIGQLLPEVTGVINAITSDAHGHIWIGIFNAGLLQLRKEDGKIVSQFFSGESKRANGLNNPHINDVYVDRYNVLWMGTQSGIFRMHIKQKPFYQINRIQGVQQSLIHDIVHCMYRDRFLWIGTRGGLSVFDSASQRFYNYPKLLAGDENETSISCMLKDSKGRLWIGTDRNMLFMVKNMDNPSALSFLPVDIDELRGKRFFNSNISGLAEDELGRIWLGTGNSGLYAISLNEKGDIESVYSTLEDHPEFRRISNLYKDPFENTLWAGTWHNGVARLRISPSGEIEAKSYKHSLSMDHVTPLLKTSPTTLWAGTIGGGLNKIEFVSEDSVQYHTYTIDDGLPDNTIHSILDDEKGNLWLGGDGLTQFNPISGNTTHFNSHDGLQSNLFIVNAACKDSSGRLYFGGPYGLNYFSPSQIYPEESSPDIRIIGLKILNRKVKVGEEINGRILLPKDLNEIEKLMIKEKENDLSIDFLCIHTAAPSRNQLKYRLAGYLNEWIEVNAAQASITYSNLKPGDYTFQIMASNGDGIWKLDPVSLEISIQPYWYKTKLAFFGYFLSFLFLLWVFRRVILIQSNLRNNLKIAQIEIEKDHEMAEMKTRFFNNITHELRTPLTLIKAPIDELLSNDDLAADVKKKYIHMVHQHAEKLLHLVNRLLDFRKSESAHFQLQAANVDIVRFAKEIFLSFQFQANDKGITYEFKSDSAQIPVYLDQEKMEIVLCNLLSNAFKYTRPKDSIIMEVKEASGFCMLEVKDTGAGMSPKEVDNIFNRFYQIARTESSDIIGTGIGLSIVKSIIELHQGKIDVQTRVGMGSTFTLALPLGKNHLSEEQILQELTDGEQITQYQSLPAAVAAPSLAPEIHPSQKKLLIVEDNPEIRAFIRSIFQAEFSVQEASDGREGMKALDISIPDLIISDIMMENMDGITFCSQVKEHPDYLHIPVILLTARTSHTYKVDGLSSGADAYLTKPFHAQVLKAQVESLLKTRESLKAYYKNQITLRTNEESLRLPGMEFLEKLISKVESKLETEELTAEGLAEEMAMSHSTLYRKVKASTGESINSFIRSIRLKRAAQILTHSELNVTEVAYQVGFSDVNYFGKCFKQQFAMSPSKYNKSR